MPSLELYKKLNSGVHNCGQQRFKESAEIMEATWYDDSHATTAYLYDYHHDNHKKQLIELDSSNDDNKVPIDIKFIVNSSQTFDKDAITYHIQLKPSQECNVDYYDEFFKNRYYCQFPIGLYIDIPNVNGVFNRWLIVGGANINDPQFPTFEVLRCDYILQYVCDNTKYEVPVVLRSQNSYNSGLYTDKMFTHTEDQLKAIAPINRVTELLYYNQHLIIDTIHYAKEPRAWEISKINRVNNLGVIGITFYQTEFNSSTDYIERDVNDNVIGMWAGYFNSSITPSEEDTEEKLNIYAEITCSNNAEVKIGGSGKKFTVKFYDNGTEIDAEDGIWSIESDYTYNGHTIDEYVTFNTTTESNAIKVKIAENSTSMMWINKSAVLKFTSVNNIVATIEFAIVSL